MTRTKTAPPKLPTPLFRTVDLDAGAGTVPLTKGERTRLKLLQSALDVFRDVAFRDARVSDICKAAGISQGTFYIYFRDKEAIAVELMKLLLDRLTRHVVGTPHMDDPFEAILESNRRYAEFFDQGGQFNRAVMQILDAVPEIKALSADVNSAVAKRIAESLSRRMPGAAGHPKERLALAYAMLGMIDAIYLGYFSPDSGSLRGLFSSAEEVVEFASFIWYRGLYGRNPPLRPSSSKFLQLLDGFVIPQPAAGTGAAAPRAPRAKRN
jgi:AcrR family transcriptional regulator